MRLPGNCLQVWSCENLHEQKLPCGSRRQLRLRSTRRAINLRLRLVEQKQRKRRLEAQTKKTNITRNNRCRKCVAANQEMKFGSKSAISRNFTSTRRDTATEGRRTSRIVLNQTTFFNQTVFFSRACKANLDLIRAKPAMLLKNYKLN